MRNKKLKKNFEAIFTKCDLTAIKILNCCANSFDSY